MRIRNESKVENHVRLLIYGSNKYGLCDNLLSPKQLYLPLCWGRKENVMCFYQMCVCYKPC